MTDTNVIPLPVAFRPHVIEGAPLPRRQFGLRPPHDFFRDPDVRAGMEAAREEDAFSQAQYREESRVRRAAREAAKADGRSHVCPTLRADLAAEINVIAKLCATAAETAKLCGELKTALTLREHQHLLETLAAEASPEGAA